jgi:hypothetical protein
MKSILTAALSIGVLTSDALSQAPRKPGAEEARIAYFAGRWTTEGDRKPSPTGPGDKLSGSETCDWFQGGFHLICRSEGTASTGGTAKGEFIISYDPAEKAYRYYQITSKGDAYLIRGSVEGKVWTWTGELTRDGKTLKVRETITEKSATAYELKFEASVDGGPWTVVGDGKATKVK